MPDKGFASRLHINARSLLGPACGNRCFAASAKLEIRSPPCSFVELGSFGILLTRVAFECTLTSVHLVREEDSMTVTARQLRTKASEVLKRVRNGGSVTVTLRGKPVAKLVSLSDQEKKLTDYAAIGMWADREDMKDVDAWLRKIRKPRYKL